MPLPTGRLRTAVLLGLSLFLLPAPARAQEQIYFSAVDNVRDALVARINAEQVRIDISAWYLTEHAISIALINRFKNGVDVRLMGDRGSIWEIDPNTRKEFYWLASQGLPIRIRYNPNWFPEIDHWKATIFVGQGIVSFGSANYTPFELAPACSVARYQAGLCSPPNYKDETVLFTDDTALVAAFKMKFDRMWNDTTVEPESKISGPPYFKNWDDACRAESLCNVGSSTEQSYWAQYPNRVPMVIDLSRLEPDAPLPADMVWGQGPDFNNRLVQEINNESQFIDFVIYRLTVSNITQALLGRHAAGVPMRLIVEPNEYHNRKWPEFWLTHAYVDQLWAAGVPIKKRLHQGLTHMKTLVTSDYATNASSNYAANWQRDHDYFVPAASKPAIYQALANRFDLMWNDTTGFGTFYPERPDAPTLASPANGATGVATTAKLTWNRAAFATSYDVYLGTSSGSMTLAANVPAQMVQNPPTTYSWTPPNGLQAGTTYYWKVVSRTNATRVDSSLIANSATRYFTTTGTTAPTAPGAPGSPSPANGATGVSTTPTLTWSSAGATSYDVRFGTVNPPPLVVSNRTTASYAPGTLIAGTRYYWQIVAKNSVGTTTGSVWSFTTAASAPPPPTATDVVIYGSDVSAASVHGEWSIGSDPASPNGVALVSADTGFSATSAPLASPTHYVEVTFNADAGTPYRIWLRLKALNNSKYNDAVWVQFSDAQVNGSPVYPINSTSGLLVNLATDSTGASLNNWGWQNTAYWLTQATTVTFAATGSHTMRIQLREDGVWMDQIVLSPQRYLNSAPGGPTNDNTIVTKQ